MLTAALFARNVELLRWSNVDGRFARPWSLVAVTPTPGRGLDDDNEEKARKPEDSDGGE